MFHDPSRFPFAANLEAHFEELATELEGIPASAFSESPDSLTSVRGGYDERGWHYLDLHGGAASDATRSHCPLAARLCAEVPGMVNAGLSELRGGTHLYPHRGELRGVLRCHLPLVLPPGDSGILVGGELRRWELGRCLVFDDTFEHEAWNHARSSRIVLLVTFRPDPDSAP